MGGKAILILIIGFSMIFLFVGHNFGRISTQAVSNFSGYYAKNVSHNLALSAANMAANQIYFDPAWTEGFKDVEYQNGIFNVTIDTIGAGRRINSVAVFMKDTSVVQVTLQPSKFSKYAYYSVDENGIWWTDGDTVNGPFHTQDNLRVEGHPVFMDETTTRLGILRYHDQYNLGRGRQRGKGNKIYQDDPIIMGTFGLADKQMPETGIPNLKSAASSNGFLFTNHDTVYLTFARDSIKYKFSYDGAETTRLASSLAPNGAIFANDAIVRIKGVVKGQYTIGVSDSMKSRRRGNPKPDGMGDIYIDDDIVYDSNPSDHTTSKDLLGIVAKNNVYITNNYPNQHDIHIDAAIYAETGGFGAEDYARRPLSGIIYLNGGVTQHTRQAVGQFNSYGLTSGFNKNYTYDARLRHSYPPFFPDTGSFEIVSWYE